MILQRRDRGLRSALLLVLFIGVAAFAVIRAVVAEDWTVVILVLVVAFIVEVIPRVVERDRRPNAR